VNLKNGMSLMWVKDAGRWKTICIVDERYGHLELQEVDGHQARDVGAAFRKMPRSASKSRMRLQRRA
jgi:hypothetical protein